METKYLNQTVLGPKSVDDNSNAPYSFKEWSKRESDLTRGDLGSRYNQYILNWFEKNDEGKLSEGFFLRQKYYYLLDQLHLVFTNEERAHWYDKIDSSSEDDLLVAIPYFAKKLKDLTVYYLSLRKKLKNVKKKYASVGTPETIQQEVYTYLLNAFSGDNPFLKVSSSLFEETKNNLNVHVEELYDGRNYLNRDVHPTAATAYNLLDEATSSFFSTKGIVLSSAESLFDCLNISSAADPNTITQTLTGAIFEKPDAELYKRYIQKYLLNKRITAEKEQRVISEQTTNVNILAGNNSFYYPVGLTENTAGVINRILPLPLSSIDINGATSGDTIDAADTMFVRNGDETKAAWFYKRTYDTSKQNIVATFEKNSVTSFRYPFPGYGIAGLNLPWTGYGLQTSEEYKYLSLEYKTAVDKFYWEGDLPEDDTDPILLNSTTLIKNKATSNTNPKLADQIYFQDEVTNGSQSTTPQAAAWLYKFEQTSLPVTPGDNVYCWPYERLVDQEVLAKKFASMDFENVCDPTNVQSLDLPFAIAGTEFDEADKIYKVETPATSIADATECCWLSGSTGRGTSYKFANQRGFSGLFTSGKATRFVWSGPDTPISRAFSSQVHQTNCPLLQEETPILNPATCTCKQVYFSPLGHNGKRFSDYNNSADMVFLDTANDLSEFDIGSWRDSNGKPASKSAADFAWYKTTDKQNWGYGNWVLGANGNKDDFILRNGKAYIYYRTRPSKTTKYPAYVALYNFDSSFKPVVWIQAKKSKDDVWESTGLVSEMQINPGDVIMYARSKETYFSLISSVAVENLSENTGSIWSVFDRIALNTKLGSTLIYYPYLTPPPRSGGNDPQYPLIQLPGLSAFNTWRITLSGGPSSDVTDASSFTFTPLVTGVYTLSLTATKKGGGIFIATNIPPLTVIPQYRTEEVLTKSSTPAAGFVMKQKLTGWSYPTNRRYPNAAGARPYWATLITDRSISTKYKGINAWGYKEEFLEEYIPNRGPVFSDMELTYDSVLEYKRIGDAFVWNQPVTYRTASGKGIWCALRSSDTTKGLTTIESIFPDSFVDATTEPTDIVLSNDINGKPIQIWYNSRRDFVWNVTTLVESQTVLLSSVSIDALNPAENLSAGNETSVATLPVLDELYSSRETGGYFIPKHLGASKLINTDFAPYVDPDLADGRYTTTDPSFTNDSLDLATGTKFSPFLWKEDNRWVMEAKTAGELAGVPKKQLTRALQTFIPYTSNVNESPLGLITAKSSFTPWGGAEDSEWKDTLNDKKSFTGVRSVSAWISSQALKQSDETLTDWVTDIYGNQYGLFKDDSEVRVSGRNDIPGTLWVRKNNQFVEPGTTALSSTFVYFEDTTYYSELTGTGITHIDVYGKHLWLQTPSVVLLVELDYNFEDGKITSVFDNIVEIELNPDQPLNKIVVGDPWYHQKEQTIIIPCVKASDSLPQLFQYNTTNRRYTKIYPPESEEADLRTALSGFSNRVAKTLLSYNRLTNKYLITVLGTDANSAPLVGNIHIKSANTPVTEKVEIFESIQEPEPPFVVNPTQLYTVQAGSSFVVSLTTLNNPESFSITGPESSIIDVDDLGVFTPKLSSGIAAGFYQINYVATNEAGSTYHSLSLSAT